VVVVLPTVPCFDYFAGGRFAGRIKTGPEITVRHEVKLVGWTYISGGLVLQTGERTILGGG
jgi:hypothetical protein